MKKVKSIPQKFEASDGTEFDTELEAQRYQKKLDAKNALADAQKAFCLALAESEKTADGHLFTFEQSEYFIIQEHWGWTMPDVARLTFYRYYTKFDLDENGMELVAEHYRGERGQPEYTRHPINKLYKHREAAVKEQQRLIDERLAELIKQVETNRLT